MSFSRSSLNTASFSFTSLLSNDSISSFVSSSRLSIFEDWVANCVILLSSSVNNSSVFAAIRPVYLSVSFIFDMFFSMSFETFSRLSRLFILSICSRNNFICLLVSETMASTFSIWTEICIMSRSFLSRFFLIISGCISSAMASIFLKPVSMSLNPRSLSRIIERSSPISSVSRDMRSSIPVATARSLSSLPSSFSTVIEMLSMCEVVVDSSFFSIFISSFWENWSLSMGSSLFSSLFVSSDEFFFFFLNILSTRLVLVLSSLCSSVFISSFENILSSDLISLSFFVLFWSSFGFLST